MVAVLTLSDQTDSINFYDFTISGIKQVGHNFGTPVEGRRIEIACYIGSPINPASRTKDVVMQTANKAERILAVARRWRNMGLDPQRRVTLTVQPDPMTVPTIYYVTGGEVQYPDPWQFDWLVHNIMEPTVSIEVEPEAASAEVTLITTGELRGGMPGVTNEYVATGATASTLGTFVGNNTVGVVDGSLWQTNRFTTTPTVQAVAVGDAKYFINTMMSALAQWSKLYLGIRVAKSGTMQGVWEYSKAAGAWGSLTTTSDLRSGAESTEFDVVRSMGTISWTPPGDWISITLNGVTGWAIRYRLTTVSAGVAPIKTNGPVHSDFGTAQITASQVKGDREADAFIHVTNANASNPLAGAWLSIASSLLTAVPPPHVIPVSGANLFVPSTGDLSVALATYANSVVGEHAEITLGGSGGVATLADRSQRLVKASSQYMTITPGITDKIAVAGAGSFFFEIMIRFNTLGSGPVELGGQWDGSGTSSWRLGMDQYKMAGLAYNQNNKKFRGYGTSTFVTGRWYMITWEFRSDNKEFRMFVNTVREIDVAIGTGGDALRNGIATPFRIGRSVSWLTSDSRNKSSVEDYLDADIAYASLVNDSIRNCFGETTADYRMPTAKRNWAAMTANPFCHWEMDDLAASLTIVDTGTTTIKNLARTTTNTNTAPAPQPGYFTGGSGTVPGKAIGFSIPRTYLEEYAGPSRVLLAVAPPTSGFTDLSTLEFSLQFNVGDSELPFSSLARQLPDVQDVRTLNNGYYLLDFGVIWFSPAMLYEGHRGSFSASNFVQCYVMVNHNLPVGTKCYVDALWLLPGERCGRYQTFRLNYDTAYDLGPNDGIFWDATGPIPVVGQTSGVYTNQSRNPYADSQPPLVATIPTNQPSTLIAVPLAGAAATNDYLYRRAGDKLTTRVAVLPRWRYLASP